MSVYVISHKPVHRQFPEGYRVLMVGACKGHENNREDLLFDDEGDHISGKNKNYCELTGLYWIWKNVRDDYVGVVHYRRFFTHSLRRNHYLKECEIRKILRHSDVIVPFTRTLDCSVREQYCRESGFERDLERLETVISELCPEYVRDYQQVLEGNQIYFWNLFICNSDLYNRYCEWLFAILGKLEKEIDLTGYNRYQERIYGFLAERLLRVYIRHNHLKVFEMGCVNTEEKFPPYKEILVAGKRMILFILNGGYR